MPRNIHAASDQPHRSDVARGCLFALGSTLVTCVLLFLNGVLLSALYETIARSGVSLFQHPQVVQFLLFVGPVSLMVVQWMMIDYLFSHIRR